MVAYASLWTSDSGGRFMENIQKRKISGTGWILIAISLMILFTCGFLTALVGIDYGPHEEIALSLTPRDPVGLFKAHPEPLWHLLTYAAVKILHCRVEIAAGLVSGLLIVLTYIIAFAAMVMGVSVLVFIYKIIKLVLNIIISKCFLSIENNLWDVLVDKTIYTVDEDGKVGRARLAEGKELIEKMG